jgi:hypothetical protein
MTKTQATAELVWFAFKGLPKKDQREMLCRALRDERLRRDLMDLAVIEERRGEPTCTVNEYKSHNKRCRPRQSLRA